jgi:hypothetical protein
MLLRTAAWTEFVSLCLLLTNLGTVHVGAIATLVGPLHGCAYLLVIGSTAYATKRRRPRLLALVPGFGGLLAERQLSRS